MYPDSGYKTTHAQSVCTGPFSRGEGPGDEATCYSKSKSIIIEERRINTTVMIFTNLRAQFVPLYTTAMAIHCVCMQSHSHVYVYLNSVNDESY